MSWGDNCWICGEKAIRREMCWHHYALTNGDANKYTAELAKKDDEE